MRVEALAIDFCQIDFQESPDCWFARRMLFVKRNLCSTLDLHQVRVPFFIFWSFHRVGEWNHEHTLVVHIVLCHNTVGIHNEELILHFLGQYHFCKDGIICDHTNCWIAKAWRHPHLVILLTWPIQSGLNSPLPALPIHHRCKGGDPHYLAWDTLWYHSVGTMQSGIVCSWRICEICVLIFSLVVSYQEYQWPAGMAIKSPSSERSRASAMAYPSSASASAAVG